MEGLDVEAVAEAGARLGAQAEHLELAGLVGERLVEAQLATRRYIGRGGVRERLGPRRKIRLRVCPVATRKPALAAPRRSRVAVFGWRPVTRT